MRAESTFFCCGGTQNEIVGDSVGFNAIKGENTASFFSSASHESRSKHFPERDLVSVTRNKMPGSLGLLCAVHLSRRACSSGADVELQLSSRVPPYTRYQPPGTRYLVGWDVWRCGYPLLRVLHTGTW